MSAGSSNDDIRFGSLDTKQEIARWDRQLPHWFQPGVAVFVTFRTADSMPKKVVARWHTELRNWLEMHRLDSNAAISSTAMAKLPAADRQKFKKLRDRLWHLSLDSCHGECLLKRPELAQIVVDSLGHFDGERYDLDSLIVMPNHVHLLVQFRHPATLKKQTASWLRYSATQINKHLGRRGAFWQSEPFDHLVRSGEQFAYLQNYIQQNPEKANLSEGEYLYWSRN